MRITKLATVGYSRLLLSGIRSFTYTPTLPIQSILGTNGSGKSSILDLLTPLPPDPDDFTKDGSKDIEFEHDGNFYRIVSKFVPKTLHTLYKNGSIEHENVNTSIILDECKERFKLTPAIHQLLLGTDIDYMFHAMSGAKRREWFTILSPTNYDYAIGLHKRLHKTANEYESGVKLDKRSLVGENAKIISASEEARIQGEVAVLHQELKRLYAIQAPVEHELVTLEQDATSLEDQLSRLAFEMRGFSSRLGPKSNPYRQERNEWGEMEPAPVMSLDEMQEIVNRTRVDIGAQETKLNGFVRQHEELEKKHAVLKKAEEDGLSNFAEKVADFNQQIEALKATQRLGLDIPGAEAALQTVKRIRPMLTELFSALPINDDRRYGRDQLKIMRAQVYSIKDQIAAHQGKIDGLREKHLHLEAHRTNQGQECPSCHHRWVNGYDAKIHQLIKDELDKLLHEKNGLEKWLQGTETTVTAIEDYFQQYRTYMGVVSSTPALEAFWTRLTTNNLVTDAPKSVIRELTYLEEDLQVAVQIEALVQKRSALSALQESAAAYGSATLSEVTTQLDVCNAQIRACTFELNRLRKQYADYTSYVWDLTEVTKIGMQVEDMLHDLAHVQANTVETLRREAIQVCIRQTQSQLARKEDLLAGIQAQKNIVADLEARIDERIFDGEVWRLMEQAMSPKDGIIADGLYGSIRNFVAQMNAFVARVWTYPLEVLPCGTSGENGAELDYVFPLMVNGVKRKDVKRSSKGIAEIVNLAYRITAMRYLGLEDYPLFMDEFAANLDKEHRFAAGAVIASLMESGKYSQLFMVSHYVEGYGAFPNSETCVLDTRNIVVPEHYNRHVVLN